eukprot:gene4877-5231_t
MSLSMTKKADITIPSDLEESRSDSTNENHSTTIHHHTSSTTHSQFMKISTAIFYGISSILVIFTNKAVMTSYQFHFFDFLALIQFIVTTTILLLLILFKKIDTIPVLNLQICREILPVSLMFLGNVLCGLGSTKSLNIPMFTALRRFSIMMTMIGEWYLLGTKPSYSVIGSIVLMMVGALIAALYDLTYDSYGYLLVFLNNIFTALNGVYMKKAAISGKVSKMGVLFYNSLFSAMILSFYFLIEHYYYYPNTFNYFLSGESMTSLSSSSSSSSSSSVIAFTESADSRLVMATQAATTSSVITSPPLSTLEKVYEYDHWGNPYFLSTFILAASMGSVLNYSIFLCTTTNSALTTAVVGALKNIITTYIGMIAFSDYTFTWVNFIGINLSVCGSLYYTYMILFKGATGFGNT